MIPTCHNRPAAAEGRWFPTGRRRPSDGKSVIRWRPRWFADRCTLHDSPGIGPNGETYPQAHGYDCAGCRWLPTQLSPAYVDLEELHGVVLRNNLRPLKIDDVTPVTPEADACAADSIRVEDFMGSMTLSGKRIPGFSKP